MNRALQYQLQEFEKQSGGTLGVSAVHLQNQAEINYNENENFILASTYKLPLVICIFEMIEARFFNLFDPIEIIEYSLRPGSTSFINELSFFNGPVHLSLLNIIKVTLQHSCNTATDILFNLIGPNAPGIISDMLTRLGISQLRVDRPTYEIMADLDGVNLPPPGYRPFLEEYTALAQQVSEQDKRLARQRFIADERDRGSPKSMTQLLQKLYLGQILSKEYTEIFLDFMQSCKTGPNRMIAMLPPGTTVARKTGTVTGFVTETGIIQLPMDLGAVALSIFIKNSDKTIEACEKVIAHVARLVFDYYLLQEK